jgi:hypothetical protein
MVTAFLIDLSIEIEPVPGNKSGGNGLSPCSLSLPPYLFIFYFYYFFVIFLLGSLAFLIGFKRDMH